MSGKISVKDILDATWVGLSIASGVVGQLVSDGYLDGVWAIAGPGALAVAVGVIGRLAGRAAERVTAMQRRMR